ncbi:MAG: type II toxin-antitoxin system Phd/YefM family antitoxin [Gracilibacteraceae bacterium]|jgi:prevent-host-death family protein|nr:type II toxin-antitoxin system Phd/YefM family antitoxin [Gracilibacteraceae bacterium]
MDLRQVFERMISVSELGRGQASKVMQTVDETGLPFFVVKNNKPQAVIISIRDYAELLKAREVLAALDLAEAGAPRGGGTAAYQSLTEEEIRHFLSGEQEEER